MKIFQPEDPIYLAGKPFDKLQLRSTYVGNGRGLKREGFSLLGCGPCGFTPLSIITRQGYFQLNNAPPRIRVPRGTRQPRFNETWSSVVNPCHPFSSPPALVRPPLLLLLLGET